VLRLPRPQRGGEDHHPAHDLLHRTAHRGGPEGVRAGRPPPPAAGQGTAGRGPPGGDPGRGPHRPGEPRGVRKVLRPELGGGPPQGRGAAGLRRTRGAGGGPHRQAVGRHAAAADDRPRLDGQPAAFGPGRAHHGPGPARPPRGVGPAPAAQEGGDHPGPHHALHGRSGAAVRPRGHRGPWSDRGGGSPAGPGGAVRGAGGGGAPGSRGRSPGPRPGGSRGGGGGGEGPGVPAHPGRGGAGPPVVLRATLEDVFSGCLRE
jgi:translation initiation factor IF-2